MTRAVLLAAAAGLCAAGGLAELATLPRRRRARGRVARGARMLVRRAAAGRRGGGGLADRVDAAGLRAGVGEVMLVKLAAIPAGALAALALAPAAPGRLGPVLLAAAPLAGFLAPDVWLRARAQRRMRTVEAEAADVLDLLRVAVAAGLAPRRALAEVGRRHPGLLAAELGRAARRAALGIPIADTIAELEQRAPATGIAPLAAALRRTEHHGAPLAPTLVAQAQEARARGAQRRAEAAARAAPQIQLVVALLLVPAVMLLVAAALLPALGASAG